MNTSNIKDLVFFNSAECNLKCNYCYITKSKALQAVDKKLKESFEDKDYYPNFINEVMGDDLKNIEQIEFWGAEPLLHLDRTFDLIEYIINHCPKFYHIHFSTNFTHEGVIPSFEGLIKLLSKYKNRRFTILVQISLDGPEEITDPGRGKGVTKKVLDMLKYMSNNHFCLGNTYNVKIDAMLKATNTPEILPKFLNKNFIIDYYKFFENNCFDLFDSECKGDPRINYNSFLPNLSFAEPYPATQEDGLLLKEVCELTRSMEAEGLTKHGLKYYDVITFFFRRFENNIIPHVDAVDMSLTGMMCGHCFNRIGFLPDKKMSGCLRMFSEYIESYDYGDRPLFSYELQDTKNLLFHTKKQCDQYSDIVNYIYDSSHYKIAVNPNLVIYSTIIQMLAKSGLVDSRLQDRYFSNKAAILSVFLCSNCASDGLMTSGSPLIPPSGKFKFMFNGAHELIYPRFYNKYTIDDINV